MNADSLGGELLPGEVIIFEDNTPQLRGSVCRYWRLSASRMSLIDPVDTPELLGTCEVGLPGHSSPWGLDHQRSQRSPPRRWRWSGINSRSLRVQLVLLNRSSINALLRDGRPATDRPWSTYPTYHILSPAYVYRL